MVKLASSQPEKQGETIQAFLKVRALPCKEALFVYS
jgi:hypothetical protein